MNTHFFYTSSLLLAVVASLFACSESKKEKIIELPKEEIVIVDTLPEVEAVDTVEEVINPFLAIANELQQLYGKPLLDVGNISFNVNETHFKISSNQQTKRIVRKTIDSLQNNIQDELVGNQLTRIINKDTVELTSAEISRISETLEEELARVFIMDQLLSPNVSIYNYVDVFNEPYIMVKSSAPKSSKEYLFWIHKGDYGIDYFAERDKTKKGNSSILFYETTNKHNLGKVTLQEYKVFKPLDEQIDFYTICKAYENKELMWVNDIKLSKINFETN